MDLPDLSHLPPLAIVAFGISLAVILAAVRLGWVQGGKSSADAPRAQVAAVIVDPKALDSATAAVTKLDATLDAIKELFERYLEDTSKARDEEEIDRRVREQLIALGISPGDGRPAPRKRPARRRTKPAA